MVLGQLGTSLVVDHFGWLGFAQYPLSQLRVLLLEQSTDEDRQSVQELGVDLFDALIEPGFSPAWLARELALQAQYVAVVDQLRTGWCRPSGT